MKSKYELTVGGRLGPGPSDAKEISMLNRIVRWTPRGIEYEADPRQVEKLLRDIELEGANGAVTPGVKVLSHQVESENDLPEKEFTRFRALAARANDLAADRIDVLYAAKEVCRFMSRPADVAMGALKRLARYLRARPRMVFDYEFQTAEGIDCYTDTDWAGCARTRKSTSGGCVMVGRHLIKAW
jgi:histone deacetylase 1/2